MTPPNRTPRVLVAIVLAFVCWASSGVVHADPSPTPHEATRRIHHRGRYPDDLLVAPPPEGGAGSHGGIRTPVPIFGGRGAPTPPPDPAALDWIPNFRAPEWLLGLLRLLGPLGYVVLALVVGAFVALFVWLLWKLRVPIADEPNATSAKARAAAPAVAASADPLLVMPELSHDELARQGRYREAVHALLVGALLASGWSPEGRARGLTAREIVAAYARPTPPREPLAALLSVVERVWFGGRDASLETYEAALGYFRLFVPQAGRSSHPGGTLGGVRDDGFQGRRSAP